MALFVYLFLFLKEVTLMSLARALKEGHVRNEYIPVGRSSEEGLKLEKEEVSNKEAKKVNLLWKSRYRSRVIRKF